MKGIVGYLVVFIIIISSCKKTSIHDPNEVLIVNDIFEKVLDDGSLISKYDGKIIAIDDYLSPLKTEDLISLKASGLYLDYDFEKEKEKVQFDTGQITNSGSYSIITSGSGKEETAKVYFSRVYFDENKKKGILISRIFCGEYCYEKKIITVKKNESSGRWTIIDSNILEIA